MRHWEPSSFCANLAQTELTLFGVSSSTYKDGDENQRQAPSALGDRFQQRCEEFPTRAAVWWGEGEDDTLSAKRSLGQVGWLGVPAMGTCRRERASLTLQGSLCQQQGPEKRSDQCK
jgi:hypothetical protein